MAVTTSYSWTTIGSSFILNDVFTAGNQIDPAVGQQCRGRPVLRCLGRPLQ